MNLNNQLNASHGRKFRRAQAHSHCQAASVLALAACLGTISASCASRGTNEAALRSDSEIVDAKRQQRDALLTKIKNRLASDQDGNGNIKWGKGLDECRFDTFAFGEPNTKAGYEEDIFELRVKFRNETLETPDLGQNRCTDTRQSRPMIVLSAGIETAKKDSMELTAEELSTLGVTDGVAGPGEVILANFFHLKRFWIARIPLRGLEKTYFQLEHFPIIPVDATAAQKEDAVKTIREAQGKAQSFFEKEIKEIFGDSKDSLIEWANNNIAGHTQIRAQFKKDSPVKLYEQLIKKDTTNVKQEKLLNIVLSSEAQGTLSQVGDQGYDPVKAINPLFFSINKIVSVHEKYSDMVVRQRHWVEQFPLHIDGTKKAGSNAKTPNFEQVFAKYIEMSRINWQSMTKTTPEEQDPAVYRTVDFTPPPLKNRSRNCTTEVITVLEANQQKGFLEILQGKLQDVTFQRAYPMLLGGALDRLGLISKDKPAPGMDGDGSLRGEEKLKATDPSLEEVRNHFKDVETCKIYFGNDEDKAKCITWAKVIFKQ